MCFKFECFTYTKIIFLNRFSPILNRCISFQIHKYANCAFKTFFRLLSIAVFEMSKKVYYGKVAIMVLYIVNGVHDHGSRAKKCVVAPCLDFNSGLRHLMNCVDVDMPLIFCIKETRHSVILLLSYKLSIWQDSTLYDISFEVGIIQ